MFVTLKFRKPAYPLQTLDVLVNTDDICSVVGNEDTPEYSFITFAPGKHPQLLKDQKYVENDNIFAVKHTIKELQEILSEKKDKPSSYPEQVPGMFTYTTTETRPVITHDISIPIDNVFFDVDITIIDPSDLNELDISEKFHRLEVLEIINFSYEGEHVYTYLRKATVKSAHLSYVSDFIEWFTSKNEYADKLKQNVMQTWILQCKNKDDEDHE